MYFKLFIATAPLAVISGIDINLFHFSKYKNLLTECIEEHEVFKVLYKNLGIEVTIANHIADKFFRRIKERQEIEIEISDMFKDLINEIPSSSKIEISWKSLETETLRVLLDCSDNFKNNDVIESSRDSTYSSASKIETNVLKNSNLTFSYFDEKRIKIDIVLDYVLVDWETPAEEMIRTREGRALLRDYFQNALTNFLQALVSVGNDHSQFRFRIRSL